MKEAHDSIPSVPVQRLETGWYIPDVLYHHLGPAVPHPEPPASFEEMLREVDEGNIQSLNETYRALRDPEFASRLIADAEAMAQLAIPTWIHPLH